MIYREEYIMSSNEKEQDNVVEQHLSTTVRAFLEQPGGMYIGGQWVAAQTGRTFDVLDPATNTVISQVPSADERDVDRAVREAHQTLESATWHAMSPGDREALLLKFAEAVEARSEDFAQVITMESGKPLAESEEEVGDAVGTLRYCAGWATRLEGSTANPISPIIPSKQAFGYTRKEAIGVVGAIIPWNFPLVNALDRVAPALTAGCTVVLKPAEQTPLAALLLARVAEEAGLPAGALNVVTGFGPQAGAPLAGHPGIAKVAFTGSTSVGRQIGKAAMENITGVNLELGGKSPMIVLEDGIEDDMLEWLALGIYFNAGQVCTSGSRLFVHEKQFDRVVAGLADIAGSMRLGHGLEPGTDMGPLVSVEQHQRVLDYIESGLAEGAEAVVGGKRWGTTGCFVEPTLFTRTTNDMTVVREEIFGPVLTAMPFTDEDEMLNQANGTPYGLTASIWSNDLSRVQRLIPRLKAGTVWVNAHNLLDLSLPFGGVKQSGIGRENGLVGVEEYLETKTVIMYY